ncbi:MAG: hypothetical protein GX434_17200 [Peptococcaceae bacterium]|nr:hypothetical protein [Peptococcaceae bacterium]
MEKDSQRTRDIVVITELAAIIGLLSVPIIDEYFGEYLKKFIKEFSKNNGKNGQNNNNSGSSIW